MNIVVGTETIHVIIKETTVRVAFGVLTSLAGPVLLRTSFIDNAKKRIFPMKRNIFLYNSRAVSTSAIKDMPDNRRVNRGERLWREVTSDSTTNTSTNAVLKAWFEMEKDSYAIKRVRVHEKETMET